MEALTHYNEQDARRFLLALISTMCAKQRLFLEKDVPFVLPENAVPALDLIFIKNPEYELDPNIPSLSHDNPYLQYDFLKILNTHELLNALFGLFRPVHQRMIDTKELTNPEFVLFILAVIVDTNCSE